MTRLQQPAGSRVEVRREAGTTRIVIRGRRRPATALFLTAWLGGWAMGEIAAARELLDETSGAGMAFLLLWLAFWTGAGLLVTYSIAWSLFGREVIAIDGRTLTIRYAAGPLGWKRAYDLASVSNLRVDPTLPGEGIRPRRTPMRPGTVGAIAFDHRGRTVRLGPDLQEPDVAKVIDVLRERIAAPVTRF
jgi:hypothetical protein